MHLKKLEIQGFKSFPEYTLIEFDEGMTAIVGPNGSGKSNVTDAIRWVLGEQSVRTLRGGKMEDVIFNGTQSRRAMNYAEVSMTLDNSDGMLSIDYYEVQVTRRLYRSGESEYQINHVNCRLKDIISLFMDTGLGKDGYSIVGQGRVDDILSTRSEDRRKVLEEASGIVKYKVRKDEAERKLNASEQNLVRITDILNELSEQVGPLSVQAEKAKHYHRVYDEWKKLDVGILLHMIAKNQEILSESNMSEQSLKDAIKAQEDELLRLRNENRDLTQQSSDLEESLENTRQERSDLSEKIHELGSQMAVLLERKTSIEERIASFDENATNQEEVERLDEEIKQNQLKIEQWQKEKEKKESLLASKSETHQALLQKLSSSQQKQSELRRRMDKVSEDLYQSRDAMASLSTNVMVSDARVKALSQDRAILLDEKKTIADQVNEAEETSNQIMKEMSAIASELSSKQEELAGIRQDYQKHVGLLEEKERELSNAKYRIKVLSELEKGRDGYQESVRRLMGEADHNTYLSSKIIGVLGELIKVSKEYETAIEIALGASLHHVVTKDDRDASALIAHLKENRLGRVTFLPVETIKPRDLEMGYQSTAKGSVGYVGIASDLIDVDANLKDIVSNLLGRIVVTDNLDHALALAKKTSFSFRIVTLDGDCVHPGGSMTGGSLHNKNGTSLLGRARELQDTKERIGALEREISKLGAKGQDFEVSIKECGREQLAFEDRMNTFSMERMRADATLSKLIESREKLISKLSGVEKELEMISASKLSIAQDYEEAQIAVREREAELISLRDSISTSDDVNKESQDMIDAIRAEIGDIRVSVESISGSVAAMKEMIRMLGVEKQKNTDGIKRMQEERENAKRDVELIAKQYDEMALFRDHLKTEDDKLGAKVKSIMNEKDELEENLSGFIEKMTSGTQRLTSLQTEQSRLEAKLEKYVTDVDEWKNRLWEDHELTMDLASEYRMEIDNITPLQKKLSELKTELKNIGPVNIDAIDEYEKANERFTFMKKQKEDVEVAMANLNGVIEELVNEMKTQFLSHFKQINDNFKVVFSDLFNGGTAEILLENEDDVLSCGIEIKAQPPGKKLQSLTLLSGGERCLTAIALLFAILQLRPSPFCVLDEVEAALDDANVNRFTDFVRRYTAKSQFILVTHRKGTMEACDRMYGVTMQERGISKILSMRLSES